MTSPSERLVLAVVVLALGEPAHADGVVTMHGREVIATPLRHRGCDDPDACTTALLRAISGLAFGTITIAAGGQDHGLAGGLTVEVVAGDYPLGSFYAGRVEALYLADRATERLRLTAVDADVLFPCRDEGGSVHAPILGQSRYACTRSWLGLGGRVGEVAWDPAAGRLAARWAELRVVANLVGASNSMAYLRGHLDASLGLAGESVWHGLAEMRTGSDHAARGVAALAGLVRSGSARWEARARAEVRPVVVGTMASVTDVGIVAEGALLYHLDIGSSTVVSGGLDVRGDRWSDPSTSIGTFEAATSKTAVFIGAVVEVRHESSR